MLKLTAGVNEGDEITVDYGDGYAFLRSWPRWTADAQAQPTASLKRTATHRFRPFLSHVAAPSHSPHAPCAIIYEFEVAGSIPSSSPSV